MDGIREEIQRRIAAKREARMGQNAGGQDNETGNGRTGRKHPVSGLEIEVRGMGKGQQGLGEIAPDPFGATQPESDGQGTAQSSRNGQESSVNGQREYTNTADGRKGNQSRTAQQSSGGKSKRTKQSKGFIENLAESGGTAEAQKRTLVVNDEDCEDIKLIIQGVANSVANLTEYEDFNYTEQQAYAIAKPAARILARYGMDERVRKLSDPVVLLLATVTTAGPKLMGYKVWLKDKAEIEKAIKLQMAQEAYNRAVAAQNQTITVTPPPPASGSPINQNVPVSSEVEQSPGTIAQEKPQGFSSTVIDLQRRIAHEQ